MSRMTQFLVKKTPEWKCPFVDAITEFILEDEASLNEIDSEVEYLCNQIKGAGQVADTERALL